MVPRVAEQGLWIEQMLPARTELQPPALVKCRAVGLEAAYQGHRRVGTRLGVPAEALLSWNAKP